MDGRPRVKPGNGFVAAVTLAAGSVCAALVDKALYALPFFLLFFFAVRTTFIIAVICALIFGALTEVAFAPYCKRTRTKRDRV